MAKVRCDYCGRYFEEDDMGALDNGSPACPECVADEEKWGQGKNEIREGEMI